MERGTRVKIINPDSGYFGEIGVVREKLCWCLYKVKINDNTFWYYKSELKEVEENV
jgi:hypothetical protein